MTKVGDMTKVDIHSVTNTSVLSVANRGRKPWREREVSRAILGAGRLGVGVLKEILKLEEWRGHIRGLSHHSIEVWRLDLRGSVGGLMEGYGVTEEVT